MQQSLAFVLSKQQADKQADLIAAQTLQVQAETALTNKQSLKLDKEIDLLVEQKAQCYC